MDTKFVQKARAFAMEVHGQQAYVFSFPYISHLEAVAATLKEFGYVDDIMLASAYLHDTIEDTRTTFQDLKKEFGEEVAEIVYCVTDELGRNRKERHDKTYPKIKSNDKAVVLKLADRIANVAFSLGDASNKLDMYQKEHEHFKKALYDSKNDAMWKKLDELFEKYKVRNGR